MTGFVESATLVIRDQTSAQLAKIERNLKKFASTARSMQSQIGRVSAAQKQLALGAGNAAFMGQAQALKRLSAATRPATAAMDKLGTSFASAATKGQRFLMISGQITRQLQAQTAAAQAARVAAPRAVAPRALGVGAGPSRQRKGALHPHGYLHLPGTGVGMGLNGDMGLGKMLAITAAAGVVINAAHVVVEGAKEGSAAREQLRQSGNQNVAGAREAAVEFAKKYGSSIGAVTRHFAEVTSFAAHEPEVQKKLVELLEQQKALAVARGGNAKEVEDGAMRVFKALDLKGTLKPDASGHVDTSEVEKYFKAYQAVQAVEGKNLRPEDFRQYMAKSGGHAQTMTTEGLQRGLLLAADIGGAPVGTGLSALNRLMSGIKGVGASKAALARMREEGFVTETGGRAHFVHEKRYAEDPFQALADHAIERMRAKGLDERDAGDVKKYVDSLKIGTNANRMLSSAINRNYEAQRQIEATAHIRMSQQDAETAATRSTTAAVDQFKNSLKNAGTELDNSKLGQTFRDVTRALTRGVNSIIADPTGNSQKAAGAGALAVTIAGAVGTAIANNPTQSALTAAVTANTAAVMANTAAQGGGLLGKGVGAAVGGGLGMVARAAGIGAAAAATAWMTYKGLGGGESKEANAKTAEIVKLNEQLSTLAHVIETRIASGKDVSEQQRKQAEIAERILKANEELAAIRNGDGEKKADSDAPGSAKWIAQQQEAARRETERRARERGPETGADINELKAKVDGLKAEIQKREASIPGAGEGERKAVLGDLPQQLAKAEADFNSVASKISSAAASFGSTAGKVEAAGKSIEGSMASGAEKVALSGTTAGAAMEKAIVAGGAKAAATIGAVIANAKVTVQGSPSRPSTGSATPQRQ